MIKCIITSTGSIILGKLVIEEEHKVVLSDPREVQIMQVGPNQTKFTILYIFGKPKSIDVYTENITLQYELEDPNILTIYEEHVSNIRRPRPGELESLVNKNRH